MAQVAPYAIISVLALACLGLCALLVLVTRRPRGQEHAETLPASLSKLELELAVERERSARATTLEAELKAVSSALDGERQARAASDQQLAIEHERAARLPGLEEQLAVAAKALSTEREARASVEQALAALREARSQAELQLGKARQELDARTAALEASEQQLGAVRVDMAALRETLDQERQQSGEKLKLLLEAKEVMTNEFQVLANDVMAKHGETFTKQNKEQLDTILKPVSDKLKEFQDGLTNAHTESVKERATLAEQIKQLSQQSAQMTSETANLTRALKGSTQMQGAWGEMVLESLLEKSGLWEGEEYERQTSHSTDDGQRLRTDVLVHLPGGQHVIIDSKVSMVAFEALVNGELEEERATSRALHLASMRAHIKGLAAKEYHSATGGGLDYVIMFVPIEGALAAALQEDPTLTSYAVQNNVAIATPTTLMMALRTIDSVWRVERRNRNAEAIADRAGHLYNKFVGFVEDVKAIGQRLGQAQSSYANAMGKLQNGPGNLIGQAEKLKELGAKTTKSMPRGMLLDEGLSEQGPRLISTPSDAHEDNVEA